MNDFTVDDIISEETPPEKSSNLKKNLIVAGVAFSVIVVLIVLIILMGSKDKDKDKDEKKIKKDIIGEINCNYQINEENKLIKIIGEDFKFGDNIDIVINTKPLNKPVKEYKFPSVGTYKINFLIYDSINMDYMFKDVSSLISAIMFSNQNAKIESMVSTFEKTKHLVYFSITGFDTGEKTSMKKLFYKSGISLVTLNGFDTQNVEDFSYIFANINAQFLDLSKINTQKATNMSHMFENCYSIYQILIQKMLKICLEYSKIVYP